MDNDKVVINPYGKLENNNIKIAISCYSERIIDYFINKYDGKNIGVLSKTNIYKIKYNKKDIIVFKSPIGASWASMVLEDLISCGIEKIVYFGSCGVLDNIKEYDILIPIKSLREEGTSYHYIKKGKFIDSNKKMIKLFENYLKKNNINYFESIVWTTDAPYRETIKKVKDYSKKNIKCVDMETSALQAIAKYRSIDIINYFYAADSLNGEKWNKRCLGNKNEYLNYLFELGIKFLISED